MFTGIVGGIGRIVKTQALGPGASHGLRVEVQAPPGMLDDVVQGDSIAINGACMTVTELDMAAQRFHIDVSAESLDKTVGLASPGPVNLEKALRANDRLGGHLVSGHVDGVGVVRAFTASGESRTLRVWAAASLARFLAVKGSITVNGVSLTVNRVADFHERPQAGDIRRPPPEGDKATWGGPALPCAGCEFEINLIPHTLQATTLGALQPGQRINLEIDLIARYVERMLSSAQSLG
ncbi:MAG: riboflavin synthase [Burkholderiaceae bacterium]